MLQLLNQSLTHKAKPKQSDQQSPKLAKRICSHLSIQDRVLALTMVDQTFVDKIVLMQ